MDATNKASLLHWAEIFDSWRIIPRIFLSAWSVFTAYITLHFMNWYMALPASERSYEESGALVGIVLAFLGFVKFVFDKYAATGRDWNAVPPTTSTVIQSTVQTTGTQP